jgi:hypothetical protein
MYYYQNKKTGELVKDDTNLWNDVKGYTYNQEEWTGINREEYLMCLKYGEWLQSENVPMKQKMLLIKEESALDRIWANLFKKDN